MCRSGSFTVEYTPPRAETDNVDSTDSELGVLANLSSFVVKTLIYAPTRWAGSLILVGFERTRTNIKKFFKWFDEQLQLAEAKHEALAEKYRDERPLFAVAKSETIGEVCIGSKEVTEHFIKHQKDFSDIQDLDDYVSLAIQILKEPDELWERQRQGGSTHYRLYRTIGGTKYALLGIKRANGRNFFTTLYPVSERHDSSYRRIK